MDSVYEKFNEYGQKRDLTSLEALMESLNEEELLNIIKDKINTANFTETWSYILRSFKDTTDCHNKRLKLVLGVLKEIEENDLPSSRIITIVNRLSLELSKLKSQHLAKLCNFCLDCIQSKRICKMGWKDLLPELFNVLVERDAFTYDDLDYTGLEFKNEFINTLCMSSWSSNIVTPLAALFIDMPLNKEEHLKVVNKLGSHLDKLTPQEIPSFVYQLLKLCKVQNGKSLFLRLQSYFGVHIYNNFKVQDEDTPDSMIVDLDAIESASNQETIEAESTVLFHIHMAASLGYECIKEYLNSLKNMLRVPEFILHPFQLMVLFTISTITHYEEMVFDVVRPCIVKTYSEEHRRLHSAWLSEMVPSSLKPEEIFAQVIHYSIEDRDMVLTALVSFAFVLLGVGSALGRDNIAEKQWNLGNLILLKIIKRKRHIASTIIQTLGNHIITRQSASQYIECLYIISKTLPLLMLENQSCIIELVDGLIQVPGHVANQLLDALIPLTKVSPTIRDHLIILLRKALYSRNVDTRQMSVIGYLKLIMHLKITNYAVLSQSSNSMSSFTSGHSLLTQISMNKSTQGASSSRFNNEALCLEVLGILKRCFMQQVAVKIQLYEGLYDAVCTNSELGIPVLDMIWLHFSEYYVMDNDQLPPLNMDKIIALKDAQSVLQEPLGKLIHAIGQVVKKASEIEENKENSTLTKFTDILESLCQRMSNCELIHFELDDGTDLFDVLPESQKKMLVLREAMCIYEALIGYKLCSWNQHSENPGNIINSLFQGYNRLLHFSKTTKLKKGDTKRKKLDKNKTTQMTQTTMAQKKEIAKHAKNFKVPDTLLDLGTIKKALSLLYEPKVSWTTVTEANVVKTKKDFHQHVMQATFHLVLNVKKRKDMDTKIKKVYFDHVTDIAVILFHRIVQRLSDFIDFDATTAGLSMECFNAILNVVNTQYKNNTRLFFNKVVPDCVADGLIGQLTVLVKIYQSLFQGNGEDSEDAEIKKMSLISINTLATLAKFTPSSSNALSLQMLDWLKNFSYNHSLTSKVSTPFINLYFETHAKYKVSLTIFEVFSVCIGDTIGVLTQEEHTEEKIEIIDEATVYNVLTSLCGIIKSSLEDIESVIARLKSEYYVLTYPGEDKIEKKRENLKTKERGVCCQLCFIVTILTNLSNLSIQPGINAEAIFKNIIHLFGTLGALTRHFSMQSSKANLASQGARFERLVKLAGKQLAPAIYQLILHMEESQKEQTQQSQEKKKSVDASTLKNKVLRETRLIPKVVYEIEQFSKYVIQLSNKTKVDLAKYVGQGTVRDFRITGLKEVLEQNGGIEEQTQSTQADHTVNEGNADMNVGSENEGSQENDTPPPSKKSRM